MSEKEELPPDSRAILKKLEDLLSANFQNPSFQTEQLNELIYELKTHNDYQVKLQDKAVEQTLKAEEMVQSSLVGFLAFDTQFVIQTANIAAAKILNRKKETLTGENFSDLVIPSYYRAFRTYQKKLLNSKQRQDIVLQLKNENEDKLYVILESIPIVDANNEIISIRTIIIDITDQRLADLKRQSELIQAAVEDILDPFVILIAERDDSEQITDFVYTYVNKATTEASHLTKEEIIGRRLLEISPGLKGSRWFNSLVSVVETGNPIIKEDLHLEVQVEHQTVKGIFHTSVNKLGDGVILTFRDITEKQEASKKLEAAVALLENSNKELEQFAYIASHDLQEPLRMMTQYSKLLSDKYRGRLDSKADEYLTSILEGATRMLVLLKDLLNYARITSYTKPFVMTDFNQVLKDVLMDLKLLIEDNKAEIIVKPLPSLMADPVQMRQLFQNLIENSIKFHNDQIPRVVISAQLKDKVWVFSVKDNGIGINQMHYERIFTIFQRLNAREKYPGSGVGLAVCKKIVERHGGRIWVESKEGEGTTFYFTIELKN